MTDLPAAFYLPEGENRFLPTIATESPWETVSQHGGPPAALLTACQRQAITDPALRLARLTVDFLGPIPRRPVDIEVRVTRPGRRVCRTEAAMIVEGTVAVTASAWHIAARSNPPTRGVVIDPPPPVPDERPQRYFPGMSEWGYGEAIDWRFVAGGFDSTGPASVWTRVRMPLIAGESISGIERAVLVADSANGLSNELPQGEWLFIPPTLTVNFHREPAGEWVHLDARTTISADGVGMATADLGDQDGVVGIAVQPLLVQQATRI